jgi:hypothetical protein
MDTNWVTVQPSAEQNKKTSCDYADFFKSYFHRYPPV